MNIISDFWWVWLLIFLGSAGYILWARHRARNEVSAQFVVTGCLLVVFYCVCFMSGVCSILNFIWRWVL